MSGYRRVNYYELCRLCTSSEGTKMHIFREEGRRRLLPTKIQICLPLQVCEDDSLPKIICNHCVDKLESFYDFRESCVNAEAMLESYFTSLRYSDDLTREGKVYVKDESPTKKKIAIEGEKNSNTVKMPSVQSGPTTVPVTVDSLTNLVQAAAIQIVGHSDQDVTRVQQYKQCPMQAEDNLAKLKWPLTVNDDCFKMQPAAVAQAVIEAAPTEARFNYQTCTNVPTPNTNTLVTMKSEGGTQTEFNNLNHKSLQKQDLNQNGSPSSSEDAETETDGNNLYHIHDAPLVKIIPTGNAQDMLVQFGFNKDKDTIFRTDDALQRSSIAQMGEFLRVKTVSIMDGTIEDAPPASHPTCVHCCKELNTPELVANHQLSCPDIGSDEKGGHFACEICGKPFKRKEHLFQHRKLHTGERPYTCNTCGKAFSRKEHLVRHAVSHTGQKTHACDMCSKTFSRKDNLHKHRKTHGIAGPYVCETCGKSFVVKHYYTMHKASHNPPDTPDEPLPYRCDICNKGFSVKQYLTTHKLRHRKTMRSDVGNNEPIDQDPLSTVNAAAILPPNVLHQGTNNTNTQTTPLFQVTSSGNNTYLCAPSTVATNQLLETYRRLHTT